MKNGDLSHVNELSVHHGAEQGGCEGECVMDWPRKERERAAEQLDVTWIFIQNTNIVWQATLLGVRAKPPLSKAKAWDGQWVFFFFQSGRISF